MNGDLAIVLVLLAAAIVMFVVYRPRMDVVALIMIAALPLTGIVTIGETLAGFSDPNIVLIAILFVIIASDLGASPYPLAMTVAAGRLDRLHDAGLLAGEHARSRPRQLRLRRLRQDRRAVLARVLVVTVALVPVLLPLN